PFTMPIDLSCHPDAGYFKSCSSPTTVLPVLERHFRSLAPAGTPQQLPLSQLLDRVELPEALRSFLLMSLAHPMGLNLRNLCLHGFTEAVHLPECLRSLLLALWVVLQRHRYSVFCIPSSVWSEFRQAVSSVVLCESLLRGLWIREHKNANSV